MKEKVVRSLPGVPMLLALLAAALVCGWLALSGIAGKHIVMVIVGALGVLVALSMMGGLYMVEPNQAAVLSLFGKYIGTVKDNGLRWNCLLYTSRCV